MIARSNGHDRMQVSLGMALLAITVRVGPAQVRSTRIRWIVLDAFGVSDLTHLIGSIMPRGCSPHFPGPIGGMPGEFQAPQKSGTYWKREHDRYRSFYLFLFGPPFQAPPSRPRDLSERDVWTAARGNTRSQIELDPNYCRKARRRFPQCARGF